MFPTGTHDNLGHMFDGVIEGYIGKKTKKRIASYFCNFYQRTSPREKYWIVNQEVYPKKQSRSH